MDDEKPTPDEEAAAAALAGLLDGKSAPADPDDRAAVEMIRAAAGKAPPLGGIAARRIARAAVGEASRRRSRRRIWATLATALAAAAVMLALVRAIDPGRPEVPRALTSRSAGMLVPGPFPDGQTAAQRLDLVTTDRMVALREVRLLRARRGR